MPPTSAARNWAKNSGKSDARSDRRSAAPECIRAHRLRAAPAVLHAAAARAVPQSGGSVCYSADQLDGVSGAARRSRPNGNRPCDDSSCVAGAGADAHAAPAVARQDARERSEEHTSELQSRRDLVCRLLLEKKKKKKIHQLIEKKKKKKTQK